MSLAGSWGSTAQSGTAFGILSLLVGGLLAMTWSTASRNGERHAKWRCNNCGNRWDA